MKNIFRGKRKHIYIWGLVIFYTLIANQQYIQFFLKDGKPVDTNIQIPSTSNQIDYKLNDLMQPIRYDGQQLDEITGYAFFTAIPGQPNTIKIVLNSGARNIVFPTRPVPTPDMILSLPNSAFIANQAEFSFLLSKNVLDTGLYQIGILLQPAWDSNPSYILTNYFIQKTPNTVKYIPVQ